MAPQDFWQCAECGSRNKTKWEFCARCGASIQEARATQVPEAAADSGPDAPAGGGSLWSILAIVVLLAAGIFAWRSGWRLGAGPRPDPAALSFGIRPTRPAPSPSPESSTAATFAEALRLAAAGDMDSAVPLFDQVMSEEPRSVPYRTGYANALWTAGRTDLALAQYREAAEIAPVPNRILLARRLRDAGRPAEATKEYEAALAANPEDTSIAPELGTVLNETGDYARAAEVFRIAVAHTANAEARAGLAFALEKTGNSQGAASIYRELLDESSARTLVRARLADLMVRGGDPQSAAKLCQEGLKLTPDAPLLHTGLGRAYDEMGKWKEAAAEYRESVRLAPNSENAKPLTERADALDKIAKGQS